MKLRRIDRFKRRPSDAHLLTPPDMANYTVQRSADMSQWHSLVPPAQSILMQELGYFDHWSGPRPTTKEIIQSLINSGHVERVETWQDLSENAIHVCITRRPKPSPKLLGNLTPLQRRRMCITP